MKVATPDKVEHAHYCLPRPGATEPRMESYTSPRFGPDGVTVVGYARIDRCQECGNRTVDGVLVRD